jgi:hypothetical protein
MFRALPFIASALPFTTRRRMIAIARPNGRGSSDKLPNPVTQQIADKSRALAMPGDCYRGGVSLAP